MNEVTPRRTHGLRGLVTSIVDGIPVSGGHTLPSTNPARLDEVVGEVSFGDASVVVRAAESAKKAHEEWAAIPAPIRGRAIAHIGRLIEDNAEALAKLVTAEIGKPYAEALGEVREIIESEGLIEQAGPKGQQLVAGLEDLREDSGLVSNVRGRGLFVAFDLETRDERDEVVTDLRTVERMIVLPCGERSIRFRPALSVSQDEIDEAIGATRRSVVRIASKELQYS